VLNLLSSTESQVEHDDGIPMGHDLPQLRRRRISFTISGICRIIVRPERWIIRSPKSCFWFCWRFWRGRRRSATSRVWREEDRTPAAVSPYVNGTPSARSSRRYLRHARRAGLPALLRRLGGGADQHARQVIAVDGKTSRRSYQKKGSKEAIHIVSAFAARQRIVLSQVKVNEKSNEIVAIPALLDMMSIEGAVVTIDAMGCQRDIAAKIIEKKPITFSR